MFFEDEINLFHAVFEFISSKMHYECSTNHGALIGFSSRQEAHFLKVYVGAGSMFLAL